MTPKVFPGTQLILSFTQTINHSCQKRAISSSDRDLDKSIVNQSWKRTLPKALKNIHLESHLQCKTFPWRTTPPKLLFKDSLKRMSNITLLTCDRKWATLQNTVNLFLMESIGLLKVIRTRSLSLSTHL